MKSHAPYFEPTDPSGLIAKIADCLSESGDPELQRAAGAFRHYLKAPGADLDACLGLKPRQGGRYETPWRLSNDVKRAAMICDLARLMPGSITAKSTALSEWIAAGGPPPGTDADVAAKLREFLGAFPKPPRSSRQIARVIKGEIIAARRSR